MLTASCEGTGGCLVSSRLPFHHAFGYVAANFGINWPIRNPDMYLKRSAGCRAVNTTYIRLILSNKVMRAWLNMRIYIGGCHKQGGGVPASHSAIHGVCINYSV